MLKISSDCHVVILVWASWRLPHRVRTSDTAACFTWRATHGGPTLRRLISTGEQGSEGILTSPSDTETSARRLVYFAAERTLFAWVRTALALMALGFVVDRFGLFVRQLVASAGVQLHPKPFSSWAGTSLIILGVLMTVVAGIRYSSFALRYQREGSTEPGYGLSLGILFTVLTAIAGIAIAVLLVAVTG